MFDSLTASTKRTRAWPPGLRLLGAAAVVLVFAILRALLLPWLPTYPVLPVLAAIALSAAAFGKAAGYFSVALCDVYAVAFYLPHDGLAMRKSSDVLGFLIFNAIAAAAVRLVVDLQTSRDQIRHFALDLADARAAIEASERKKDLLLRETGHRIKNNLMTLIGIIHVQQRSITDESARAALSSTTDRIQVFARVHERLVASDSASVVDMAEFLRELCDDLLGASAGARPISLDLTVEPLQLPQQKAVSVGLIVNELVTNAVKHAFPNQTSGTISVSLKRREKVHLLEVRDNGVGLPAASRPRDESSSIGQLLVRAMAAQLGGALEIKPASPQGTLASVNWPAP